MISDSIPNASVALASSNPKDFAKKKRANRSAKLKQCKLDARREQWLSQVKNKGGCKEDGEGGRRGGLMDLENKNMPVKKLQISPRGDEGIFIDGLSIHHFSDFESSPSNSPTSSVLGSNDSGVNFTSSSRSSSSSGRSSSCSTNGCFSGIMSEEDEGNVGDDGCLDDWEAMADALAATEDKQQEHKPSPGYGLPVKKHGNTVLCGSELSLANHPFCENDITSAKQETVGTSVQISQANCQAWRPDDAFRPQSLPNLSKQYSFQLNSERRPGLGGSAWGCKNVGPVPTSCPICYDDFDFTDSSFIPCLCGFKLCLFCHKRILEGDARCPGCRKKYDCDLFDREATLDGGSLTFRLTRSCSMTTRP
ncbi:hypothetical protein C2S53_009210 [Perilla frutescens var. hirtella]|uniref:RING-type domain-containing protein n=1 Tax=Perilla frutescens var. hirtella TaxID=608512 RepID=A0AAD4NXL3_PERFH|nr:hypothetical protein C2S53_009210 [Perilla frutescens var. hirtella]